MTNIKISQKIPDKGTLKNYSLVIIDKNVNKLYYEDEQFLEIIAEEKYKTLETANKIREAFYKNNIDRKSYIAIVGGGLTLDLAGFAASTWMRGIKYDFFPTTLLAQVDASIGGKTAVNYKNIKNLIGTFYLPENIFIHLDFLKTLDKTNIRSGFAEMIKHFLLKDKNLFYEILKIEPYNLNELYKFIPKAIEIKQKITEKDFTENNLRQILNLGHTIGHAIEIKFSIPHGEAIALGMLIELFFAHKLLNFPSEILTLLYNLFLKWEFPLYLLKEITIDELMPCIKKDKKKNNETIIFAVLKDLEKPYLLEFLPKPVEH